MSQYLFVSTEDAGIIVTTIFRQAGLQLIPIPGAGIVKFVLGQAVRKPLDKIGKMADAKIMMNTGSISTSIRFETKTDLGTGKRKVFMASNNTDRTGSQLYFQDEMLPNDVRWMDIDDELRIQMSVTGLSEEEITSIIDNRKQWKER